MMTRAQTVAVAPAVQQCRPEWDHAGIVAALEKASTLGTPAEVAAAACRLASNLKPVSYTHLAVYKRQRHGVCRRGTAGH